MDQTYPASVVFTIVAGICLVIVGALGFIPNPFIGVAAPYVAGYILSAGHLAAGVILLVVGKRFPRYSALVLILAGIIWILIVTLLAPATGSLTGWLRLAGGAILFLMGLMFSRKPNR
ncbi:MAG: hypothetical protein HY978_00350 [Candidatus Liptonbacteria bacterium]|nr:hypothetical protein [Candidatus Liptonbacteria bacterium]